MFTILLIHSNLSFATIFWIEIHYIAKSIDTPSNERFDDFSHFHEYKS